MHMHAPALVENLHLLEDGRLARLALVRMRVRVRVLAPQRPQLVTFTLTLTLNLTLIVVVTLTLALNPRLTRAEQKHLDDLLVRLKSSFHFSLRLPHEGVSR